MKKFIECVPNFSEGVNQQTIEAIASAIRNVAGVSLLHQDSGVAANRTVYTFAGEMQAVFEAAYQAIKVATELIDMQIHKGEHPRIGACDVCPFVPISGISMEELIITTERFAQKVAQELNVPIFLYEYSAKSENRKNLANHRIGNYEALERRIVEKRWLPDFGSFNAKSGATVMGARNFLVAYNINLNSTAANLAQEIAYDLRSLGRPIGKENGKTIYQKGQLEHVKAIGWYIEDFKRAQVSINLTNYKETSLASVFETTKAIAKNYGLEVTGSELIGLIPKQALLEAGKYYVKNASADEESQLNAAIKFLGLDELKPFDYKKRVLEYVIDKKH
tara:strand:- start:4196 stop:5200 length:1005 start_codon:yes stop_codon:yes gene_type:complete